MTSSRPKIPREVELNVLYRSAYSCVICQKPTIQIHHIDKNRNNNAEENLAPLCQEHHGEAHTQRELTLSLTQDRISGARARWEAEVVRRRASVISVREQRAEAGEFLGLGVAWGYINHSRVATLALPKLLTAVDQETLASCRSRGLVDSQGYILIPNREHKADSYVSGSIYDRFDFGDDHRIHRLYSDIVDKLAAEMTPTHVDDWSFTKGWVEHFANPGKFLFIRRGHYFKDIAEQTSNVTRKAYVKKGKVRFEYLVETKDMFGTSSMTVSFRGHQTASALVMVKSVEHGGGVVVHCTPVALGTGCWPIQVTQPAQRA